jgi:hypothetical protein
MSPLAFALRLVALYALLAVFGGVKAAVILYDQNFESPNNPPGFIDTTGRDVSQQTVNALYGGQPPGFTFSQVFTVETLEINGGTAFGDGYSDPSGRGGNYALGMLSSVQDDLLGLSFSVGTFDFLNVAMIISSIDLDGVGGPFGAEGTIPRFRYSLRDGTGLGGTLLNSQDALGVSSPRDVFIWTDVLIALDATGSTNGTVTLVIDLIEGNYASMDNFRIVASDIPGDVGNVPEPGTLLLFLTGILAYAGRWGRLLKFAK